MSSAYKTSLLSGDRAISVMSSIYIRNSRGPNMRYLPRGHTMVFGESNRTGTSARLQRKWYLSGSQIQEADLQHHLGILRSVLNSSIHRTNEKMLCSQERLLCAECCWISVWMPPPHHNPQTLLHPLSSNSSLWRGTVGSPQV